jgi:Zn-dependent protease
MLTIFSLIVLMLSIMIHEIAHGSVAQSLGDPTAKYAGRLTLNPLKHIDLFGTIFLPLTMMFFTMGQGPVFGWAKPVPVNPYNFRDQKWGEVKVSLAGVAANFLIALVFGMIIRFFPLPDFLLSLFGIVVFYNILLGLFNLIPIPPLDGSHVLFHFIPERFSHFKIAFQQYGMFILIFFIFFGFRFLEPIIYGLYNIIVGA